MRFIRKAYDWTVTVPLSRLSVTAPGCELVETHPAAACEPAGGNRGLIFADRTDNSHTQTAPSKRRSLSRRVTFLVPVAVKVFEHV